MPGLSHGRVGRPPRWRAARAFGLVLGSALTLGSCGERSPDPAPSGPAWSISGGLLEGRSDGRAFTLPSGEVIVAGGQIFDGRGYYVPTASSERFDAATGRWTQAGSMTRPRRRHCGVTLATGEPLVIGGFDFDRNEALAAAETYDRVSDRWQPTDSMWSGRFFQACVLLPGGEVLVAGGITASGLAYVREAEVFDPASRTFSVTGSMSVARALTSATLLRSGKVLVAGGCDGTAATSSAELYDPDTGTWSPAASLPTPLAGHTATLLPDGEVLVTAHLSEYADCQSDGRLAALYDPVFDTWREIADVPDVRFEAVALPFGSGDVLLVGGYRYGVEPRATWRYEWTSESWVEGPAMIEAHGDAPAATRLLDGRWLVAGGVVNPRIVVDTAEFIDATELLTE